MMSVYKIDPLSDPRWPEFLQRQEAASIFHTPGWLAALQRTYNYKPIAYTTCGQGQDLVNGLVFCLVDSKLTGRRLVSLPFSDHCQSLVEDPEDLEELLTALQEERQREGWKYVELRSVAFTQSFVLTDFKPSKEFYFHKLDIHTSPEDLFRSFHRSCVQQKIRRAEREDLTYKEGRSPALVADFYRLLLMTRRKHHLPPQPLSWFHNLVECLGERLTIRVAFKNGQPAASILTLLYKNCCVYKYACSDPRLKNSGATVHLVWQAIKDAKAQGACEFDMGRSDMQGEGLVAFKDHWNAPRSSLVYYRNSTASGTSAGDWRQNKLAQRFFANAPDWVLTTAGKLLYKHVG